MADTKPLPDGNADSDRTAEELTAYLDGELDPKAAESMATKLSLDPQLRAEADALQRAWDILDVLPRPQPSAAFISRTVSQVIPVSASMSEAHTEALPRPTAPALVAQPANRSGPGFWIGSAVIILLATIGGYIGHRVLAPAPKSVVLEPPLEDVTMLKNLRLYRHVDDLDYLKKLDSPELFGDHENNE